MLRLSLGMVFAALVAAPVPDEQPGWGDIKGRVVWTGDTIPDRAVLKIDRDKEACLAKGPLLSEEYVVDKQTKGVKWVMVWLVDAKDAKAKLPIHPDRVKFPEKVSFDAPCCVFEPHVLGVREGQTVVFKGSATIPHVPTLTGTGAGPSTSQLVLPGKSVEIPGWKASTAPTFVRCSIHPWMQMYLRVFDHPYFAVTDEQGNFEIKNAPAGDYKLVVWHEAEGWVVGDKTGVPITIEPGKTTDRPVKMTPRTVEPPQP